MIALTQVPLRLLVTCLDGGRIPLNREERSAMQGSIPYWGAGNVVDWVNRPLFHETLILLGEDGAPFFDPTRSVAFVVDEPVWVNNHIHVLRPGPLVDPKFLSLALNCVDFSAYITGATRDKLTQEDMNSIRVPLPSLEEQRRIADFLDDQVTRIENIIAARKQQLHLAREEWSAQVDQRMNGGVFERIALRRLLERPPDYGANEGAEFDNPDWPRYIRTTDVDSRGALRPETFRSLPPSVAAPYLLRDGDLLFTRSGSVGKSFLYHSRWGAAAFAGYLIRLRPNRAAVLPEWIRLFTVTPGYWRQIAESSIQATISNVNAEKYSSIVIPTPGVQMQKKLVGELMRLEASERQVASGLTDSISLLVEFKRSLISAAVSGEFDVSSASGRGVPA
ncbi:MAG: restriction endonuclease subunit S [Candidatus Phosphoribacter sp.]